MSDEDIATPSAPPVLFGRYRVAAQVGTTRLATVYAATDERLQRRVLVHLLRKELVGQAHARERFVRETSQMAQRSHPALLEVFDHGEVGGRPFVVTEHSAGRPLYALGMLTVEQALLYLRQLAGAVAVCQVHADAHRPQGLYHPPLSSRNVLLIDEGQVHLVDSWLVSPEDIAADLAHYRAPELSEGRPASPASAVYALGMLLYELLVGARPITGGDAQTIALAHLHVRLPPLRDVRPALYLPALEALLARATARLPEHRFADAQSFGAALDQLWRELGAHTRPLRPLAATVAPSAILGARQVRPETDTVRSPQAAARPATSRLRTFASSPTAQRPSAPPWRQQNRTRNLIGWFVMVALVLAVAGGSYVAVTGLAARVGSSSAWFSGLPSWFEPPTARSDAIYVVNIAEGLNLRREPNANDPSNIITVVPNGATVRKLEGPRVEGNIPWLRVRAEVDGRAVEGWMSLNYLVPQ